MDNVNGDVNGAAVETSNSDAILEGTAKILNAEDQQTVEDVWTERQQVAPTVGQDEMEAAAKAMADMEEQRQKNARTIRDGAIWHLRKITAAEKLAIKADEDRIEELKKDILKIEENIEGIQDAYQIQRNNYMTAFDDKYANLHIHVPEFEVNPNELISEVSKPVVSTADGKGDAQKAIDCMIAAEKKNPGHGHVPTTDIRLACGAANHVKLTALLRKVDHFIQKGGGGSSATKRWIGPLDYRA